MKEELQGLWTYRSKPWAPKFFPRSFGWATHSRLEPMAINHRARGFRTARVFTLAMLHCLGGLELPQWTVHRFA